MTVMNDASALGAEFEGNYKSQLLTRYPKSKYGIYRLAEFNKVRTSIQKACFHL